VTIADQQVETCLRAMIEARYPSHGIIGEEYGAVNLDADFVWVLDPINGTHAFICGLPLFGTLISLTYCKRGLLGLMDQAISGEQWFGARGHGATSNAQQIRVRSCARLADVTTCMPSPDYFRGPVLVPFEVLHGPHTTCVLEQVVTDMVYSLLDTLMWLWMRG
jgi:inositol-phosphate phosphatase/L-galactose 1-phosphate phosphatase/histidinol-phosphatase